MKMKRILLWLLTVAMIMTLLPCFTLTASAASNISYKDANGNKQIAASATDITKSMTRWTSGWYYASGNVTIGSRVTVSGDVHLILADGAKLTVNGGIAVNRGNKFTIYGQDADSGVLTSSAAADYAGIGGNSGNNCGEITINGGTIVASSASCGAGIGGGYFNSDGGEGGKITINGGNVTATVPQSNREPAGIGGGGSGQAGTIIIRGGVVNASGSGKGIGGGAQEGGSIHISGGIVTTNGIGTGPYSTMVSNTRITGNAIVITTSGSINETHKSSWHGLINYTAYGNVTLTDDLTVPSGSMFGIDVGNKLTVAEGVTLTINDAMFIRAEQGLIVNGNFVNNGVVFGKCYFPVTKIGENVTIIGEDIVSSEDYSAGSMKAAEHYTAEFIMDDEYELLRENIIVEVNGKKLTYGWKWNAEGYVYENGILTIYRESFTGGMKITAKATKKHTITFDANGGTGTMDAVTNVPTGEYTLPLITTTPFTAPEGTAFKGWEVDGTVYAENAVINVTSDTTVKAVWTIPAEIQIQNTLVYSSKEVGYQLDEKITRYWKNGDSGTFTGTADDYNMKIDWSTRNGKDVATITLKGANTVDTDNTNYGLLVLANNTFDVDLVIEEDSTMEQITVYSCDVNISGDGKLIGHDMKTDAQNIYVDGDLTISGANIYAESLEKNAANVIFATGDMIIDNSVIDIASGSDWGDEYNYTALRTNGAMTIRNGSDVSVTCIDGTTCYSVMSVDDMTIEDSTVTVVNNGTNRGISAGKDLYIKQTNGTTNVTVTSNGISLAARSGKLTISGGTVELASAANDAMRANEIEITGNAVVTANASSTAIVAAGNLSVSEAADVKASGRWSLWSEANNIAISGGTVEATSTNYAFVSKPDLASYTNSVVFAGADANGAAFIVDPAATAYNSLKYVRIQPGYVITFDANGGTMTEDSVFATDTVGKLAALPADPNYTGYIFKGWFDAATGGEQITTDTVFNAKTTVYAQWEEITYDVWVGGTQIKELNKNDVFGDGKVKFDTDTNTLTLNGYSYNGDKCGISTELDELNIVLVGESSITNTNGNAIDAGEGAVTISGDGELTIVGGIASGSALIAPSENMIVFVTADDSANAFAEEGDITELVSGAASVKISSKHIGDLSGDGELTNADIIMLARYLVDLVELTEEQLILADMDGSGEARNNDLVIMVRKVVEA